MANIQRYIQRGYIHRRIFEIFFHAASLKTTGTMQLWRVELYRFRTFAPGIKTSNCATFFATDKNSEIQQVTFVKTPINKIPQN